MRNNLTLEEEALVIAFRSASKPSRRLAAAALMAGPSELTDKHVRTIAEFVGIGTDSDRQEVLAELRLNYHFNRRRGFPEGSPFDGIKVPLEILEKIVADVD